MKKSLLLTLAAVLIGCQSNAMYRDAFRRTYGAAQQYARNAYNRGANALSNIGAYTRGYMPKVAPYQTTRPLSNYAYGQTRNAWSQYSKPAIAAGLAGAGLGAGYAMQRPAYAEEIDLIEQKFQEINKLIEMKTDLGEIGYLMMELASSLIKENKTSEGNKRRYIELESKRINLQEEKVKEHFERAAKNTYDPNCDPHLIDCNPNYDTFRELINFLMEFYIPHINLVNHPEELDHDKFKFYIPQGMVNALKYIAYEKGHLDQIIQRINEDLQKFRNQLLQEKAPLNMDIKQRIESRLALLNAIKDLIEKDFPQKNGYITYPPETSWIPWNWVGY